MSTINNGNPNEAYYGHEPVEEYTFTSPSGATATEKHFDFDGDGQVDNVYADHDGDGGIDMRFIDTDGDGTFDYADMDTDGDGIIDTTAYDTDGDGRLDTAHVDTDGDGYADQVLEMGEAPSVVGENGGTPTENANNLPEPPSEGESTEATPIEPTDEGNAGEPINDEGENSWVEGAATVDSDGDGVADAALVDSDGDGIDDALLIDQDADGLADEVWVDTDGDGAFDQQGIADSTGEVHEFQEFDGPAIDDLV